jgi:tetratricopeptide (TPR) repeat protein
MKPFIYCILLFLCLPWIGYSQSKEELYEAASTEYDRKNMVKAIDLITRALYIEPKNTRYLLLKASALDHAGQYQAAYDTYTTMIQLDPKDIIAYNNRGLLLSRLQEYELALKDFDDAINLNPPDTGIVGLYLNRGSVKTSIRDFIGAYEDYTKALSYDSLNIAVLNNLAGVCDEIGKGDLTLKYLNKIITIDSSFIGAYANIGFKYQEMGDYKTAITYYNKVLEMDPREALGYSNRSYNRYKLGENEAALKDINESIRLYPGNSYAYRVRGLIYLAMKDPNRACKDFTKALEQGFTRMYGEEVENLKKKHCTFDNL